MTGDAPEDEAETVLTSRRAWLHGDDGVLLCRLRLTDKRLQLTPSAADPALVTVALPEIRSVRAVRPVRPLIEIETAEGTVRFRCFAAGAVVGLIRGAVARSR